MRREEEVRRREEGGEKKGPRGWKKGWGEGATAWTVWSWASCWEEEPGSEIVNRRDGLVT